MKRMGSFVVVVDASIVGLPQGGRHEQITYVCSQRHSAFFSRCILGYERYIAMSLYITLPNINDQRQPNGKKCILKNID